MAKQSYLNTPVNQLLPQFLAWLSGQRGAGNPFGNIPNPAGTPMVPVPPIAPSSPVPAAAAAVPKLSGTANRPALKRDPNFTANNPGYNGEPEPWSLGNEMQDMYGEAAMALAGHQEAQKPMRELANNYQQGKMQSKVEGPRPTEQPVQAGPSDNDVRRELGNRYLDLAGESNVRPAYNPSYQDMVRNALETRQLQEQLLARNPKPIQDPVYTPAERAEIQSMYSGLGDLRYQNQSPLTQPQATQMSFNEKQNIGNGDQMEFVKTLQDIGGSLGLPSSDPTVMDIYLQRQGRRRAPTTEANMPYRKPVQVPYRA